MLFAWSVSGFIIPGIGTLLTASYGTAAFMALVVVIAILFCLFVIWRVVRAAPGSAEETGSFAPMSAQVPPPVEPLLSGDTGEAAER